MLEHRTDAPNHLANFISSNFGDLDEEPNTVRQGTTVASVNVLSNTADIYMPVPTARRVHFADPEGVPEEQIDSDKLSTGQRPKGCLQQPGRTALFGGLVYPVLVEKRRGQ